MNVGNNWKGSSSLMAGASKELESFKKEAATMGLGSAMRG